MRSPRVSTCGCHRLPPARKEAKKRELTPELIAEKEKNRRSQNLSRWVYQSLMEISPSVDAGRITHLVSLEVQLRVQKPDQQAYLEDLPDVIKRFLAHPKYQRQKPEPKPMSCEDAVQVMCL